MIMVEKEYVKRLFSLPHQVLASKAIDVLEKSIGSRVCLRGIIEISNICIKNCSYCGIRRDRKDIQRYLIPKEVVLSLSKRLFQSGYHSVVLQAGDRRDDYFIEYINELIFEIKRFSGGQMRIVLSLGEQDRDVYKLWRDSGADRYLLRIETSNPSLYSFLHPEEGLSGFEKRCACLLALRELGYQVGTGVMIGLPGQDVDCLVEDVIFFKHIGAHMLGMGPYIPTEGTPLHQYIDDYDKEQVIDWSLKMIAICRIVLKDVNIASTTALDTLKPGLRLEGFNYGANVLMPDFTPKEWIKDYEIYDGKPESTADYCLDALGPRIAWNNPGDPKSYIKPKLCNRGSTLKCAS